MNLHFLLVEADYIAEREFDKNIILRMRWLNRDLVFPIYSDTRVDYHDLGKPIICVLHVTLVVNPLTLKNKIGVVFVSKDSRLNFFHQYSALISSTGM